MEPTTVAVFGATGGIGSELARVLACAGRRVVAVGRDPEKLSPLSDELGIPGHEVDATDPEAVEAVLAEIVDRHGRLDGVANCVGSLLLKPAHLTSPDDWSRTLATNLGSAFAIVRAAGRLMKDGGSIVLVSSAAARLGLPNHEAIAAAKAGVEGLVRSAAATYASRNLRCNAVAPGLVRTPMTERITSNDAAARSSTAMHALGRLGEPGDVARMIAWLLDPEQGWVTGQVFGVDGGLATTRARGA
jgi:NAD(P)-dependent dehydrogenase (short-subunit alcohol dehydrogenase family)